MTQPKVQMDWQAVLPDVMREKILLLEHRASSLIPLHSHEYLELTYITRGTAEHCLDGQTVTVREGDYFIVDYGSRHSYRNTDGQGFDNTDCLFLPELLDPVLKGTKSLRSLLEHYLLHFNQRALAQNPVRMVFHDSDGRVGELIERMQKEQMERAAGYTEFLRCYLVEILLLTLRRMENASAAATGDDVSSCLVEYIREHYMEQITLGELAKRFNYSLPYLSKRFREDVGVSFVSYLQSYRVMEGCRLLASTNRTLADIAGMVGYRDVKFFANMVKRHTGFTPREFRRRHHGS
ncbi:MAG: helix-turn-helix domain-containing protein [Ruminococcaceae bacterium]|nr:helix-turn-helix domain-containing protein [Oscillospiraceae bacterium]